MASREVNSAVGEAPAKSSKPKGAVELLKEKRTALVSAHDRYAVAKTNRDERAMGEETRLIASLTVLVTELDQEVARAREQEGLQRAKARVLGIRRAYGSLCSEMDEDEKRVVEKIAEVSEAIARLNDRYTKTVQFRAEVAGLCEHYELEKPKLPNVVPPVRRGFVTTLVNLSRDLLDWANERRPVEECEYRLRTRRTYAEIEGTEGYEIILSTGLKPFPELTERQKAVVADRNREQHEMRRQFSALPAVPAEGSSPIGGAV